MESPETVAGLIAWSIASGATLFALLAGVVLSYHWFRYGMKLSSAITASLVYGAVSIFLLSVLFAAVLQIT